MFTANNQKDTESAQRIKQYFNKTIIEKLCETFIEIQPKQNCHTRILMTLCDQVTQTPNITEIVEKIVSQAKKDSVDYIIVLQHLSKIYFIYHATITQPVPIKVQTEYNFINYRTTLRFEEFLCATTQLSDDIILYKATMQLTPCIRQSQNFLSTISCTNTQTQTSTKFSQTTEQITQQAQVQTNFDENTLSLSKPIYEQLQSHHENCCSSSVDIDNTYIPKTHFCTVENQLQRRQGYVDVFVVSNLSEAEDAKRAFFNNAFYKESTINVIVTSPNNDGSTEMVVEGEITTQTDKLWLSRSGYGISLSQLYNITPKLIKILTDRQMKIGDRTIPVRKIGMLVYITNTRGLKILRNTIIRYSKVAGYCIFDQEKVQYKLIHGSANKPKQQIQDENE